MTPTEQTVERRARVAEACCPDRYAAGLDWNPKLHVSDWKALVLKVAELIEDFDDDLYRIKFAELVATNNVAALSSLVLELLENENG